MNPLEAATADELIEELQKRFEAVVFAAVRRSDQGETDTDMIHYSGGIHTAVGLAVYAAETLTKDAVRGIKRQK